MQIYEKSLMFPVAERNVEKGTVPNFTPLQQTETLAHLDKDEQMFKARKGDCPLCVIIR